MTGRHLTVFICDDLWFSLTGKLNAIGIYPGDLIIPGDQQQSNQLVFYFLASGELTSKPTSVTFEITLPGEKPNQMQVPPPNPPVVPEGRTKWIIRLPFVIMHPILRPGRIIAKAIFNDGELLAATPWIVKGPLVAVEAKK